jgi:hypothetical protein
MQVKACEKNIKKHTQEGPCCCGKQLCNSDGVQIVIWKSDNGKETPLQCELWIKAVEPGWAVTLGWSVLGHGWPGPLRHHSKILMEHPIEGLLRIYGKKGDGSWSWRDRGMKGHRKPRECGFPVHAVEIESVSAGSYRLLLGGVKHLLLSRHTKYTQVPHTPKQEWLDHEGRFHYAYMRKISQEKGDQEKRGIGVSCNKEISREGLVGVVPARSKRNKSAHF